MITSDERNVRKSRAKSIESASTCTVAGGNITVAFHILLTLILITSGIVTAAPPPPPETMPLWHSASTLASLGMSITPPPESSIALHHFDLPCQTCHIPVYAKEQYVKTWWDWSTAGELKDGEGDFEGRVMGPFLEPVLLTQRPLAETHGCHQYYL